MPVYSLIYFTILILAISAAAYNYKKNIACQKIILLLLIFTLLLEILAFISMRYSINNLWLMHAHAPIELSLILVAFHKELPLKKNILILLITSIFAITIFNSIYIQSYENLINYNVDILELISCIAMLFIYLGKVIELHSSEKLINYPMVMVLFAFSFFYIASLSFSGLLNYYQDSQYLKSLHYLSFVFNYLLYFLLGLSFFKHKSIRE